MVYDLWRVLTVAYELNWMHVVFWILNAVPEGMYIPGTKSSDTSVFFV